MEKERPSFPLIILRTQSHSGHLRVPAFQLLQAQRQELVPIIQEESLLRNAQQARDKREQGQALLLLGRRVQGRRVQTVDEVLQNWDVDFGFDILHKRKESHQKSSKIVVEMDSRR